MIPFAAVVVDKHGNPRAVGRNAQDAWAALAFLEGDGASVAATRRKRKQEGMYIQRFAAPEIDDTE